VDLASIVAGAIVGTVIGWMGKEFLPPLWRRIQGRPPVIIHVETNPAVFEAGLPRGSATALYSRMRFSQGDRRLVLVRNGGPGLRRVGVLTLA
jgi:hypothetical protein